MTAARRTAKEWRIYRQWKERQRYRRAGAILEDAAGGNPFKQWGHYPVGISAVAGAVKVYGPDGTLREIVSAAEWRRRHGDPFAQVRRRDHGEAEGTADPGEGEEDAP
mgnify:FL=1